MNFLTIAFTRAPRLPAPAPLPEMTYDHAKALTQEFWHGLALGIAIGAGGIVGVLGGLGRL